VRIDQSNMGMKMKKIFYSLLPLLMCGLLSACGSINLPIRAVSDKSEVFTGTVHASLVDGSFMLTSESGIACHGTYDQFSREPNLKMYITCSDGRHGVMLANRDLPVGSGSGTGSGTLNDGTKITFAYGKRISEMKK